MGEWERGILGSLALHAPLWLGAWWLSGRLAPRARGAARWLAAATLGWAWVTLSMQVLGALGWLSLVNVVTWSVVLLGLGAFLRRRGEPAPSPLLPPVEHAACRLCEMIALGLATAAALRLGLTSFLGPVKVVSDGPIYHLYFAVRWWQAGRVFLVGVPFGESAATYFPANGSLWFTWLIEGWGGDRLARIGQVPFWLLAATAVVELSRTLGASRSGARIAACWFACGMPFLVLTFEPNVDTLFVAGYLIACLFFIRHWKSPDQPGELVLAGLAAGLAWGTKPTSTLFVTPLLGLFTLALAIRGPGNAPRRASRVGLLVASSLLGCVFWFARNTLLTGNPLYPAHLPALGWMGWYQRAAMANSPYWINPRDLWAFADLLFLVFDPRLAPIWLLSLAGAWALRRKPQPGDAGVWACGGLVLLNAALFWLVIPYRTEQRFLLHSAGLAAIPLARLITLRRFWHITATLLLAAHMLTPQNWPFLSPRQHIPWDLSQRVPSRVGAVLAPSPGVAGLLIMLLLITGATLLVIAVERACRDGRAGRWALAVGWAVLLAAALAGLQRQGTTPAGRDAFFPYFPDYNRGWLALEQCAGGEPQRVAYAGTNIPYYLFGGQLANHVQSVAITPHHDWLLHDYHRAASVRGAPLWPNPRPGWDRLEPSYEAWLANLRAARIDLLVVCQANPAEGLHNPDPQDPLGFPIERRWAEAHPAAFEPCYGVRQADPKFRIYRILPGG